jgi:excisionase family DNA binding protein
MTPHPAAPAESDWISVADAAAQLGINRRTLTRAAQVGNLEARRVRQLWLTTLPAAQAWLKAARHRPGPRPGRGLGRPRAAAEAPAGAV